MFFTTKNGAKRPVERPNNRTAPGVGKRTWRGEARNRHTPLRHIKVTVITKLVVVLGRERSHGTERIQKRPSPFRNVHPVPSRCISPRCCIAGIIPRGLGALSGSKELWLQRRSACRWQPYPLCLSRQKIGSCSWSMCPAYAIHLGFEETDA